MRRNARRLLTASLWLLLSISIYGYLSLKHKPDLEEGIAYFKSGENSDKAIALLSPHALGGNDVALTSLVTLYGFAQNGVPYNEEETLKWVAVSNKFELNISGEIEYDLAITYAKGSDSPSIPVNHNRACFWLERSADAGNLLAKKAIKCSKVVNNQPPACQAFPFRCLEP